MHTMNLTPATVEELNAVDRWLQHDDILRWLGSYTTGRMVPSGSMDSDRGRAAPTQGDGSHICC
ncbi:hypothetical protein [Nocardia salmonicida]|uniref:hypothetical protein n=1 Tax=Nocardia salmonicida TaxID=53431 RepID=UPI0037A331AC